jgi:SPP1 gp7 family putative phage head morphogenesis protein
MPAPEAQKAVEEIARQVAALDQATAARMIREYAAVYTELQGEAARVVSIGQQRNLKVWEINKMTRLTELQAQLVTNVNQFSRVAGAAVTEGQRAAVGLSVKGAPLVANAGLPTGITLDSLANIGLGWNRLPAEAFEAFVGISGDGKPIGNLLAELGEQAAADVKAGIRTGIATGQSPREVANVVRHAAGMPLTRALTISRTEINRSHREATRLNYAANSNVVKGYRRLATKDAFTCMACIALDGTLYETNEPLDAHPNCRCTMVPETLTYQDLGLDIPEEARPESGQEWFNGLSKGDQENMMGAKTFAAFQQGKVGLSDLVTTSTSTVWGKSSTVKSVKALGL